MSRNGMRAAVTLALLALPSSASLTIEATRKGAAALRRTVAFELCG